MKKKLSLTLVLLAISLFCSCTAIMVRKHPDYNFTPTKASSIRIYTKDLMPVKKFLIIGELKVDRTWAMPGSGNSTRKRVMQKASVIGGDGVLILDTKINIVAFNRGVKTTGRINIYSNTIVYSETKRNTTAFIPIIIDYGYVIKFIK